MPRTLPVILYYQHPHCFPADRAAACPFGGLLSAICPLPEHFFARTGRDTDAESLQREGQLRLEGALDAARAALRDPADAQSMRPDAAPGAQAALPKRARRLEAKETRARVQRLAALALAHESSTTGRRPEWDRRALTDDASCPAARGTPGQTPGSSPDDPNAHSRAGDAGQPSSTPSSWSGVAPTPCTLGSACWPLPSVHGTARVPDLLSQARSTQLASGDGLGRIEPLAAQRVSPGIIDCHYATTDDDDEDGLEAAPSAQTPAAWLSEQHTPHARVAAFLWACLTRICPRPLLGSTRRARRRLRLAVRRFVSLRRFEGVRASDLAEGLPLRAFGCLGATRPATAAAAARARLLAWVAWLFAELVIPLLRAHFYATEADGERQRVLYYRCGTVFLSG